MIWYDISYDMIWYFAFLSAFVLSRINHCHVELVELPATPGSSLTVASHQHYCWLPFQPLTSLPCQPCSAWSTLAPTRMSYKVCLMKNPWYEGWLSRTRSENGLWRMTDVICAFVLNYPGEHWISNHVYRGDAAVLINFEDCDCSGHKLFQWNQMSSVFNGWA